MNDLRHDTKPLEYREWLIMQLIIHDVYPMRACLLLLVVHRITCLVSQELVCVKYVHIYRILTKEKKRKKSHWTSNVG